jgi:transmembrane sensor
MDTSISTQVGEIREVTLADGSSVRLSAETELHISLSSNKRTVVIDHGAALFRVAKDPTRPFIVNAAGARIQATGTMFAVTYIKNEVEVTVAEGKVTVTPAVAGMTRESPKFDGVSLKAHERVSVSSKGLASLVHRVENLPIPLWNDGRLVFEDIPVAEVVIQFNLHNVKPIRIADNTLAARLVSGTFNVTDPLSFVEFLQASAGASSIITDREIVVVQNTDAAL